MKKEKLWSPYIAGISLGLTLLATLYIAGRGLGASGAFSLVTGVGLHALAPDFAGSLKYFSQYFDSPSPLLNWNIFLVVGLFIGAFVTAFYNGNFKVLLDKSGSMSVQKRVILAFIGGGLIGFASRLARGCTSGVALTGGAELALSGWIFVLAMFISGFVFAALFRRLWS